MSSRREFFRRFSRGAIASAAATKLAAAAVLPSAESARKVALKPYQWSGAYAQMRDGLKARHDAGLCAEVRATWMAEGDRLILRSSEIVGYEKGYFYDDHLPTYDPEGRGKGYQHISFQWDTPKRTDALSADCVVPGKGKFWLRLQAQGDYVDVELGLRNDLAGAIGDVDWAFCLVGHENPSIGDVELTRTFLFDGQRLRTLREMTGAAECEMYLVAGARGFVPAPHIDFPKGPVQAKASVVVVEAEDHKYAAAIGFAQAHTIYSNPVNKCFHADPYFGPFTKHGEQRTVRGKIYLIEGSAQDALARYRRDFGA